MIWGYHQALKRAVERSRESTGNHQKQEIAVAVFLSITVIEVFLNVFFRNLVEKAPYQQHREKLKEEIKDRISLDRKWESWPNRILGRRVKKELDERFKKLRELRNNLMHFTTNYETLLLGNNVLKGVSNTSEYDNLTVEAAKEALRVVDEVILSIIVLNGVKEDKRLILFRHWTGGVPSSQ